MPLTSVGESMFVIASSVSEYSSILVYQITEVVATVAKVVTMMHRYLHFRLIGVLQRESGIHLFFMVATE